MLVLALTCVPVQSKDQVKHLRGETEPEPKAVAKASAANLPEEAEEPLEGEGEVDEAMRGPEPMEFEWVPYTYAMEGPPQLWEGDEGSEGDWDDDVKAQELDATPESSEPDARSFVAWRGGRRWGHRGWGGRWGHRGWGRGWGRSFVAWRGGRRWGHRGLGRGWGRGWGHRGWGGRGWGRGRGHRGWR